MNLIDRTANALRLQDAVCRRTAVARWELLQNSERERWRLMARAAYDELVATLKEEGLPCA